MGLDTFTNYFMRLNGCLQVVMRKHYIVEAPKPSSPQVSQLVAHMSGYPRGAFYIHRAGPARCVLTYQNNGV